MPNTIVISCERPVKKYHYNLESQRSEAAVSELISDSEDSSKSIDT